jgi:hypothetical protein
LRIVVPAFLAVAALAKRLEGEPPPFMAGDVLIVRFKPRCGRIVKNKINVKLEQIGAVPENLLFDRVTMLGEEIQGSVELIAESDGRRSVNLIHSGHRI